MSTRRPAGIQARRRRMSAAGAPSAWVPQRRLRAVWLLSALLHVAIILLWLQQTRPSGTRQVQRMAVRIIPMATTTPVPRLQPAARPPTVERQPDPGADVPRVPMSKPAPPTPPRPTRQGDTLVDDPTPPSAAAWSGPVVAQPITAPEPASPAPPPASSPIPGKLQLDWTPPRSTRSNPSSPTLREQVLNDTRANTPRQTPEARLARTVGDDKLSEEALGDGRRRFRQGSGCADVHRTNIAQLNPFDARLKDTQVAKPCD